MANHTATGPLHYIADAPPRRRMVHFSRRIYIVVAIVLAVTANRLGIWAAQQREAPERQKPPKLSQIEYDWGEVLESEEFHCQIVLLNSSGKPVRVSNIQGDCSCTRVLAETIVIPPGGRGSIPLSIDLTQVRPGDGRAIRDVGVSVTGIWCEEGSDSQQGAWVVQGRVRRYLDVHFASP